MKVFGSIESRTLTPLQVAGIGLVIVVVGGGSLLLSAPESRMLVDGAVEWREDSILRAVVATLCLNYRFPTVNAGEIKGYLLGLGAGLAALSLTVGVLAQSKTYAEETDSPQPGTELGESRTTERTVDHFVPHISPLAAAQLLALSFVAWSFVSSRWSAAPELAVAGSMLLGIQLLWSFCLSRLLKSRSAVISARAVFVVLTAASIVAVWYYQERNPTLRAKFPFGNPTFLSAALIPGILLGIGVVGEQIRSIVITRRAQPVLIAFLAGTALLVQIWAFQLADSRGSLLGLLFGILTLAFFGLKSRWRLLPIGAAVCLTIAAYVIYSGRGVQPSTEGRDATIRFREYAWSYAWQMFREKPLTGHGQGGFALKGDGYSARDVLEDPPVFESRIEHAHNEWLEVMSDLGLVGIVLIVGALLLTLRAGIRHFDASAMGTDRWIGSAILASLVALTVEECFGVGLRVSEIPTFYFTILGLSWAVARPRTNDAFHRAVSRRAGRIAVAAASGLAGLLALLLTQRDFDAARSAYRAEEELNRGDDEAAVRHAVASRERLNPHRALVGIYRLCDFHVHIAGQLLNRAVERENRARAMDVPDVRLLQLAEQDRRESEEHCRQASHALKELVARSPGYLNHGWLEYLINLTQADHAAARGDEQESRLLSRNAAAAVERELARQPFNAGIALSVARTHLNDMPLPRLFEILARPLRNDRFHPGYVPVLRDLSNLPGFDEEFQRLLREALDAANPISAEKDTGEGAGRFAPELLRLGAMILFFRGEYVASREALEAAASAYERLRPSAPKGAAGCYAELADSRFFHEPRDAEAAIEAVRKCLSLLPASEAGRSMQAHVEQRMIDYSLAAGDENTAWNLLVKTGPPGVDELSTRRELGLRYRGVLESLLLHRREAWLLPRPANDLLGIMRRWADRSLELNPEDSIARFLAADLSLHAGEDQQAVMHLREAKRLGQHDEDLKKFLQLAREKQPNSEPLEALWNEWFSESSGR